MLFGQRELIDPVITGILARGHILLEGLPGQGKTEPVKGLSKLLESGTKRVQLTPGLLLTEITENQVLQEIEARPAWAGNDEFIDPERKSHHPHSTECVSRRYDTHFQAIPRTAHAARVGMTPILNRSIASHAEIAMTATK